MTAKISSKSFAIEQQNEQIAHLLITLKKVSLKDDKLPVFHKETLIYKIVDFYKITPTKAKEYLQIIASRGNIEINGQEILYIPSKEDKKDKTKIEEELKEVFNNIGEIEK